MAPEKYDHPLNWVFDGDNSVVEFHGQRGKIVGHTEMTLQYRRSKKDPIYEPKTDRTVLVDLGEDGIVSVHETRIRRVS